MRRADRNISETNDLEEIIRKADVCRIALANDNYPYIVTLNFGYKKVPEQRLYFHCAKEGKKLDMIRRNNHVCFEMDVDHELYPGKNACDWGMKFSSVIGYGYIVEVTDKTEKLSGMNCLMEHYGGSGEYYYKDNVFEQTTLLRLDITEMTGKRK
jgi:uncharacterized protein